MKALQSEPAIRAYEAHGRRLLCNLENAGERGACASVLRAVIEAARARVAVSSARSGARNWRESA